MKFLLGYNIKFVIYWGWGGGGMNREGVIKVVVKVFLGGGETERGEGSLVLGIFPVRWKLAKANTTKEKK